MTLLHTGPAPGDAYASALLADGSSRDPWWVRYDDGARHPLGRALARWCGTADATDRDLLARAHGPVLDVGCGPGRLVAELDRQGRQAAGLDVSEAALRLARRSGAAVVRRSVFDAVPGEGSWDTVLLADGNIGIGGDPAALLARCRSLVGPGGRVLVELDPPGTGARRARIRLESRVLVGAWFDWAHLDPAGIVAPAAAAGLSVQEVWERGGRWFAALVAGACTTDALDDRAA